MEIGFKPCGKKTKDPLRDILEGWKGINPYAAAFYKYSMDFFNKLYKDTSKNMINYYKNSAEAFEKSENTNVSSDGDTGALPYSNNEEIKVELEQTMKTLQKLQKQLQKQVGRQAQILGQKLEQELEQESEQELEQKQKQGQLQSDIDKVTFGNIGNNKVIVFVQPVD